MDPKQALAFALEKYPERLEVTELSSLVMESARQNAKRPAYVKLGVPDELVKRLRGKHSSGDLTLLVHLPEEVIERSESLIVLPGEVG